MQDHSPPLRLFAAGSLRFAIPEIVATCGGLSSTPEMIFGPAGLLRERIEGGDVPDIFLSANMEHPAALSAQRPGSVVQAFARNALVALARRDLGLTTANFLDRLLADGVKIGTSTPVADPSGDYAQQVFALADAQRPGAGAVLVSRARNLVGGRDAAPVLPGQSPVHDFLASGDVDVFLTYFSNAALMTEAFDVVRPPPELTVMAIYGFIVLTTQAERRATAERLAAHILSPSGQAILGAKGFAV